MVWQNGIWCHWILDGLFYQFKAPYVYSGIKRLNTTIIMYNWDCKNVKAVTNEIKKATKKEHATQSHKKKTNNRQKNVVDIWAF